MLGTTVVLFAEEILMCVWRHTKGHCLREDTPDYVCSTIGISISSLYVFVTLCLYAYFVCVARQNWINARDGRGNHTADFGQRYNDLTEEMHRAYLEQRKLTFKEDDRSSI